MARRVNEKACDPLLVGTKKYHSTVCVRCNLFEKFRLLTKSGWGLRPLKVFLQWKSVMLDNAIFSSCSQFLLVWSTLHTGMPCAALNFTPLTLSPAAARWPLLQSVLPKSCGCFLCKAGRSQTVCSALAASAACPSLRRHPSGWAALQWQSSEMAMKTIPEVPLVWLTVFSEESASSLCHTVCEKGCWSCAGRQSLQAFGVRVCWTHWGPKEIQQQSPAPFSWV